MDARKMNAEKAARTLIGLASCGVRVPLTQLHVHKLLYFAQGSHLLFLDKPLFEESILAWRLGPVVRELRPLFSQYKKEAIPSHEGRTDTEFDQTPPGRVLARVWKKYQRYSARELVHRTHAEAPWKLARVGLGKDDAGDREITRESIRTDFVQRWKAWCAARHLDADALRRSVAQSLRGEFADFDLVTGKLLPR